MCKCKIVSLDKQNICHLIALQVGKLKNRRKKTLRMDSKNLLQSPSRQSLFRACKSPMKRIDESRKDKKGFYFCCL